MMRFGSKGRLVLESLMQWVPMRKRVHYCHRMRLHHEREPIREGGNFRINIDMKLDRLR